MTIVGKPASNPYNYFSIDPNTVMPPKEIYISKYVFVN